MLFHDKAKTRAVSLRARLIRPFCGLLWLSASVPAAVAAPTPASANAGSNASANGASKSSAQRFRFDAGAPLAAGAEVAPDGSVCVGTVDGYVHGLGSDGSLSWVFKLFSAVESELASDESGTIYFVAADHFLYGLTAHGAVSLRTRFRPGMKPELSFSRPSMLRDPEGNDWRGRSDGVLEYRLAPAETASLLPLTSSPLLLPAWASSSRFVVVSARSGLVFGLDPARIRPSR